MANTQLDFARATSVLLQLSQVEERFYKIRQKYMAKGTGMRKEKKKPKKDKSGELK